MTDHQVGLVNAEDGFEELTDGDCVTAQHVFVDGDSDKEVVILDPMSGASSNAPASSGIPSAVTQRGVRSGEMYKPSMHTPMGGRVQRHEEIINP
jgi:hypothetical protein